ncbi:hypothetical protein J6590_106532, partial [Homalodisca vitripennis]
LLLIFRLVLRLNSDAVPDVTPGIWRQQPYQEIQNKSKILHRIDIKVTQAVLTAPSDVFDTQIKVKQLVMCTHNFTDLFWISSDSRFQ